MLLNRQILSSLPPFLGNLSLQIQESRLLENHGNVVRLHREFVGALVNYLGLISLQLQKQGNQDYSVNKSLREPEPSDWMEQLRSFEKINPGDDSLSQELSECLNSILEKSFKEESYNLSRMSLEISGNKFQPKTVSDLLAKMLKFLEESHDRNYYRSNPVLLKVGMFCDLAVSILCQTFEPIFQYPLATLESFLSSSKGYVNFLRAHHGNLVIPFKSLYESRLEIGSVFLLSKTEDQDHPHYELNLNLSPFLISSSRSQDIVDQSHFAFFISQKGSSCEYKIYEVNNTVQDQNFEKTLREIFDCSPESKFQSKQERIYYYKLLDYWKDGFIDESEEQAIQILHKVYNIGLDRLRELESMVKQELGIPEETDLNNRLQSYKEKFASMIQPQGPGPLERAILMETARNLSLRAIEIWSCELECLRDLADSCLKSNDLENLEATLVQIALLDFQNPILVECEQRFGIDVSEHPLVKERTKAFTEYMGYVRIVYADQHVTPDERRFLDIQRKRLGIQEREAFELEYLEESLLKIANREVDDYYTMQKENFKLGGILLAQGLIEENQLQQALEIQSRDPGMKLGALLYDLGHISHENLKRCLELQKHLYFRKGSYLLGNLAQKFALLDSKQLKECLQIQEKYFQEHHVHKKLGDIMLNKGYLSQQALSFLLSIQSLSESAS